MSTEEDVNTGDFEENGSEAEDVGGSVNETVSTEPKQSGSALTINIQSWATPIVGVVMLVLGLLAGYFIRPLLPSIASRVSGTSVPVAAAPATSEADVSVDTTPAATEQPANLQELMTFLLPQVKHFKGDPNAPVTLIEFGDFQ